MLGHKIKKGDMMTKMRKAFAQSGVEQTAATLMRSKSATSADHVGEDAEVPENVPAPRANHTATCVDNSPHSCFVPLEAIFFSIVHHALRSCSKTSKHSAI